MLRQALKESQAAFEVQDDDAIMKQILEMSKLEQATFMKDEFDTMNECVSIAVANGFTVE